MKESTTFVLFGMTGDLVREKILPALYELYMQGHFSDRDRVVGFSRRPFSDHEIRTYVEGILKPLFGDKFDSSFLEKITYVAGDFADVASYKRLAIQLVFLDNLYGGCSNKLFYMAVPPQYYTDIVTHLSASGLSIPCGGEAGWSRILLEKPFGHDIRSAQDLERLLLTIFREEQIFRIDHYLAKEKLADFLKQKDALYTAQKWNSAHIEKVHIQLYEQKTINGRGSLYDTLGALLDVGQNHMLEVLACVAALPGPVVTERARVISSIVTPTEADIAGMRFGQYEGYRFEPNVSGDSYTETFFSLDLFLDMREWKGTTFRLSAGKALGEDKTAIEVTWKDGTIDVFSIRDADPLYAYSKVLSEAAAGNKDMFVSPQEILAEWSYVSPILEAKKNKEPFVYKKGELGEEVLEKYR